jgi:DNA-directed RNA polymerase specialized sigma24 family protein
LLQRAARSDDAKSELFADLLSLEAGFWQRADIANPRPETLKGYVLRVSRQAISMLVRNGMRPSALDPDDLCQDLLLTFFRSAPTIRDNPRGWFVGVAVRKGRNAMRTEGRFLIADALRNWITREAKHKPSKRTRTGNATLTSYKNCVEEWTSFR